MSYGRNLKHSLGFHGSGRWTLIAFMISILIITPLLVVFSGLFAPADDSWRHIVSNLLPSYTWNTVLLMLGVGILSFFIGVNAAWVISMYRFPGRRFFEWALILPLAIPAYINGFAYAGMLDFTSPLYSFLRKHFSLDTGQFLFFDLLGLPGAIFIFSISLYPYVYLIARTYFQNQSSHMLEAGASLGLSPLQVYFKVGIPLARPAIVAGISLILMEVLNDYGLVKYFGVDTFTTGIFSAWFAFGNIGAALKLSVYLMFFVLGLLLLERYQRKNRRFAVTSVNKKPEPGRIAAPLGWLFFVLCALPFLLGFGVPVFAFTYWTFSIYELIGTDFIALLTNSFYLALITSVVVVMLAVFLAFTVRTFPTRMLRFLTRTATLGYAIPGAVVAIGLLVTTLWVDAQLRKTGLAGTLFAGSLLALVYAYVVRFMAVAFNSIESGNARISIHIDQVARSLGASKWKTMMRINLPLLRGPLMAAALLVFIDVLKELPLTLILRPFNMDTLAIRAFEYATDERIAEASPAALVIILAGIAPVFLLNRLLSKPSKQ
jgi:iron(III) transport system permease protein